MSLRHVIAQALRDDVAIAALLTGGVYPTGTTDATDQTALSRLGTPAAFDARGDVLPCAVVAEEPSAGFGPIPLATLGVVRIWLYQQRGRATIDAVARLVAIKFDRARVTADGRPCTLRYAGTGGSSTTDQALRDASLGWVRVQANYLLALPH